jgi:hypothetical protein
MPARVEPSARSSLAKVTRQATIADLQRDTALAWLERSYQESMRELLRAQIAQAELQVQAAETLYRSGKGSQAEVFAARGSVEQLRDGLAQASARWRSRPPNWGGGWVKARGCRWLHVLRSRCLHGPKETWWST